MINNIITAQSIVRRYLSNKKNIYKCLKIPTIVKTFKQELIGYHMVCETPIKESIWEEINRNIVSSTCTVSDAANGNHKSGKDNRFNSWNISNKTGKANSINKASISSYRLTNVTSPDHLGSPINIINEINNRDSSFDYYSLLVRKEISINETEYIWYIIPKDFYLFNASKFGFEIKLGKRGRKLNKPTGWKNQHMEINFSMSSQLWFHFNIDRIKQFIISSVIVNKNTLPKINYAGIYQRFVQL